MTFPTLLVLAAGIGNRYGGLKQIDPVGPSGESILDYSIYDAIRAGFGKVVFVIRREIEQPFKARFGESFQGRIAVDYVFQELGHLPPGFSVPAGRTKPWGTAQAVLMAAGAIEQPFAVINADDFYGAESYRVMAQHLQAGTPDYAMLGYVLRNTLSDYGAVARGVCRVSSDDCLESVTESIGIEREGMHARNTDGEGHVTRMTGDEVVSMNFWGFTPRVFGQLQEQFREFLEENGSDLKSECYLPNAVNNLILAEETRVKVLHTREAWFGVTYREDHLRVVENIRGLICDGYYPKRLWS
ncbi:sugar phosphate nucleotidyltransferase [Acidicapsa acidisoli]|uniref:sugar phosphate nucleotidyltransferase n=1 Tax=Acidicapsa acidisoli TaxID=1615681 RepID=UPI0021DF6013|nr:sugar phosphate nucleotidyltransferase [Acidicapsa acidisoli]